MTNEEMLEYAKVHYPPGTKFIPAHVNAGSHRVKEGDYFELYGEDINLFDGVTRGCTNSDEGHFNIVVYSKKSTLNYSRWATILEHTPQQTVESYSIY